MSEYELTDAEIDELRAYKPVSRRIFKASDGTTFTGQMATVGSLFSIERHTRSLRALEKRGAVTVEWEDGLPFEANATWEGMAYAGELEAQGIPPLCLWPDDYWF